MCAREGSHAGEVVCTGVCGGASVRTGIYLHVWVQVQVYIQGQVCVQVHWAFRYRWAYRCGCEQHIQGAHGSPADPTHTCCTHSPLRMSEKPPKEPVNSSHVPREKGGGGSMLTYLTPPSHGKILALGLYMTASYK